MRGWLGAILVAGFATGGAAGASARDLRPAGKVTVEDGYIADAFGLDDRGATLAYVHASGAGQVRLHVGPVGGRARGVDIAPFSASPERVVFVGGRWFVVASDGQRKAIVVAPGGRIGRETSAFGELLVSTRPAALVTLTERPDKGGGGRALDIVAYRPDGARSVTKQLTIEPDDRLAGYPELSFVGFGDGFLEVIVRKPGGYDRRADARGAPELAVLDLRTGKTGAGRPLGSIPRFLEIAAQRNERPGWDAFVSLAEGAGGLLLVGPGLKVRPLRLPARFELFAADSLRQQRVGGRLLISLTVDPLHPERVAAGRKGPRSLRFFAVDLAGARASAAGELPLEETQDYAWSAGGGRVAVLKKTAPTGGPELAVYAW
jgi:hypothetical protein